MENVLDHRKKATLKPGSAGSVSSAGEPGAFDVGENDLREGGIASVLSPMGSATVERRSISVAADAQAANEVIVDDHRTAAVSVQGPSTATVMSTGSITINDDSQFCLTGLNTSLTVNGLLKSTTNNGVLLTNSILTVGSNPEAKVIAASTAVNAFNGGTVNNNGVIAGANAAIFGGVENLSIVNAGRIEAGDAVHPMGRAITWTNLTGEGRLTLLNDGIITSPGIAITGSRNADVVVNRGRIEKTGNLTDVAIDLGNGDDHYDGRDGGTVGGEIHLGAGNDILWGGAGAEAAFGGAGADDLRGNAGADVLDGGSEADILEGGSENDILIGGGGADYLDGGAGDRDIADYSGSAEAVDVALIRINGDINFGGDAQGDRISNVEDILGSSFNDRLGGNGVANTIDGKGGRDSLYGYGEADTLIGSEGDDWLDGGDEGDSLDGGANNDTLIGGCGNDTLEGGSGVNTAVFSGALSNYTIQHRSDGSYLVSDLRLGQDGADVLNNIQFVEFGGQRYAIDQIIIDPDDPAIPDGPPTGIGLSGTAVREYEAAGTVVGTLSATDPTPNESFAYRLLDDAGGRFTLSGNQILVADGFRLDHEQAASHTIKVKVTDRAGNSKEQSFVIGVTDINPEITTGSAGNDVFFGGALNDVLGGNLGNDRLFGQGGADILKGEAGNDVLGGGAGRDKLYGGKGSLSRDAFVFDTKLTNAKGAPNKSLANQSKDQILDFGPKYDSIYFDDAAFTNKTIAKYLKGKSLSLDTPVKMKASFFKKGDKAADRDDFFIYNDRSKKLYFDVDGSGVKAMVEIASLKLQKGEGTTLTYKDFFFI